MNFVEYCISAFFVNLNSNDFSTPNYYDLTLMAKALILAETPVDAELLKQVEFIEKYTDEQLMFPISVLELAIFRNWQKQFHQEISIYGKELTITELHYHANRVLAKLITIVCSIAKKYSLELQFKKGESKSYTDLSLGGE